MRDGAAEQFVHRKQLTRPPDTPFEPVEMQPFRVGRIQMPPLFVNHSSKAGSHLTQETPRTLSHKNFINASRGSRLTRETQETQSCKMLRLPLHGHLAPLAILPHI